jgi:2-dehydro-3-deoxyphosphogluconate aldolase / (4S)-4-hydroxy-2-oxoglutarate aldolase
MTASSPGGSAPLHGAIERLAATRALFILRGLREDAVLAAATAIERAGFSHLEITSDSPGMPRLLERVRDHAPGLVLGAGTVLDIATADAAIDASARFLVSPQTDAALIERIAARGAAALPGAFTPTEILLAHRAGAAAVKLFPGPIAGPDGLRDIRGPFPFIRFVPTGGITLEAVPSWLEAGALAVGIGRRLLLGAHAAEGRVDDTAVGEFLSALASVTARRAPL